MGAFCRSGMNIYIYYINKYTHIIIEVLYIVLFRRLYANSIPPFTRIISRQKLRVERINQNKLGLKNLKIHIDATH